MKRIVAIIGALTVAFAVQAMDERLGRINSIKKSVDYLYGEATMPTQENATSLAYELLQKEVLGWAQHDSLKLNITSVAEINSLADSIITRRAEMYRVFVYVKKTALLPVTEQAEISKDSLATDEVKRTIKQRFFGRKQNDALYHLKQAKNFFELKEIMQPLKEKGDIIDYGKYATAERPEECYLIVYDPAGNIKALLGKGDEMRTNLKTGHSDSIKNYRGCGAIWFTIKE